MKSNLPVSGGTLAAAAAAGLPPAPQTKTESKVEVWFNIKHEHRGVQYKKNQSARLDAADVTKLEKLGKISKTKPEDKDA